MDIIKNGFSNLKNILRIKMNNKKKLINYIKDFADNIKDGNLHINDFNRFIEILKKYKKKNHVHIFGNGGSASIASHFSMDLTNNSNIKCFNYNDASLITCYSNDFGYENWISRVINKYVKKGDLLILISSSGKSKNMLNAIKIAKLKKIYKVVTFTGFEKNNPLKIRGDLNFWVDSRKYNFIENIHQFWLLMIVDILKANNKN